MKFLRLLSRLIDELNIFVGQVSIWMILASTLISAGNALARYSFGIGSNALLEIQWYLFAAVFTLGAGYAFLRNVHVRIDFLAAKFSARGRNWVDVIGIIVFLFPLCYLMFTLAWPVLMQAYNSGETSFNPGGLIRWPLYAFIVVGFSLLALQGLSELIKRIEFLYFDGPDVLAHKEADPIATEA
ncbi:MAG: TRAP transporter small permease subunit [Burkholderiaceae bacterium]|jgi:TRAP-type mannitol/chloroaromatic compound transport system permease small subunit